MEKAPIAYQDTWVRMIGSLFVSHFQEVLGRNESFFYLLQQFYYIDLISGFFIALIIWEFIRQATKRLDKYYSWETNFANRSLLQIILGILLPSILTFFLVYIQQEFIVNQDIFEGTYLQVEFPVCVLFIVMANLYYWAYYFYNRYQDSVSMVSEKSLPLTGQSFNQVLPSSTTTEKKQVIVIHKGGKNIPLPVQEIAYFFKEGEYNYLRTFTSETHLADASLDELSDQLDEKLFFRANRQTIVNFYACQYYSPLEYGKLEVLLHPPLEEPVNVSQKKAANFKSWLDR